MISLLGCHDNLPIRDHFLEMRASGVKRQARDLSLLGPLLQASIGTARKHDGAPTETNPPPQRQTRSADRYPLLIGLHPLAIDLRQSPPTSPGRMISRPGTTQEEGRLRPSRPTPTGAVFQGSRDIAEHLSRRPVPARDQSQEPAASRFRIRLETARALAHATL